MQIRLGADTSGSQSLNTTMDKRRSNSFHQVQPQSKINGGQRRAGQ